MERRIYLFLLALTLALGTYLRLVDLGGPSLWHDEIIHLRVAEQLADEPWYRTLTGIREVMGFTENGPIYYWMLILGQRLAPGEVGARLIPAILGILALPFMAFSGLRFGGRLISLTATFLLAVSPLHVYFSREARPYSLIMLLALVFLHVLLEKGSRVGIGMAYGGCLLASYVGIHTVPILLSFLTLSVIALLWDVRKGSSLFKSPYLHGVVAATLALALVYGLYMTRSDTNKVDFADLQSPVMQSPVFLSPLSQRAMERFLASMTTSAHRSVLMVQRSWVLVGFALVGLAAGLWRRRWQTVMTAGMFFLPAGLSILALVLVGRWYALRYTCSALPAFLLLIAAGIVGCAELGSQVAGGRLSDGARKGVTWATAGVLMLLAAAPNFAAARADPQRKLDWRGVAAFIGEIAVDGEPIVIANAWPRICLGYYLRDSERDLQFVDLKESVAKGESVVESTPQGWLLTAGFRKSGDVRAWMHGFPPVLKLREEEMALFFFPDFVTLLETRFAAGRGGFFEKQFAALNQQFDFSGAGMTLQGTGWSFHEENKEGINYQWALGEQAELGLPIGRPRDARLRFRALPFMYPDAPPQNVELWLNQSLIAAVDLPRGWSEHEIEAPEEVWSSSGANILYLRFGRTTVPAEAVTGSKDRRSLSAAFDYLEVVEAVEP